MKTWRCPKIRTKLTFVKRAPAALSSACEDRLLLLLRARQQYSNPPPASAVMCLLAGAEHECVGSVVCVLSSPRQLVVPLDSTAANTDQYSSQKDNSMPRR
eukprot:57229-Rhodomonas_salina.3